MRKFNTNTISAAELNDLLDSRNFHGAERERKAANLLMTWWALGHDPARHALSCPSCHGAAYYDDTCGGAKKCGDCDEDGKRQHRL